MRDLDMLFDDQRVAVLFAQLALRGLSIKYLIEILGVLLDLRARRQGITDVAGREAYGDDDRTKKTQHPGSTAGDSECAEAYEPKAEGTRQHEHRRAVDRNSDDAEK